MHLMIDLETMSLRPNAALLSIGAVFFDGNGVRRDLTFYESVDLATSVEAGGHMDPDTVMWWMNQSDDARKALNNGTTELFALDLFQHFSERRFDGVWGNGAAFDNVVLRSAYERHGRIAPWSYRLDRCYRTVRALSDVEADDTGGTAHNALDDAIYQAEHLVKIHNQSGGIL